MANQFPDYITATDFLASSMGRGTSEADATIYCDIANSILEGVVDYWYIEDLEGADRTVAYQRVKSAGILIASAFKSNPNLMKSVSIGRLSSTFASMESINQVAAQLIKPYIGGGGSGGEGKFSIATLER